MAIERLLITGAGGFLGKAILRELGPRLDDAGDPLIEIRALDLDARGLPTRPGVEPLVGSVTDEALVTKACEGVDGVLHCASLVDWGNVGDDALRDVNVGGTARLLDAARACGVRSFVYTSSMDVVCGRDAVVDVDERAPYPVPLANLYCETKAEAEALVLEYDDRIRAHRLAEPPDRTMRIRTAALRPCGMYGEHDPYHVKNVLDVVRAGKLVARIGDGSARFEHVYVGNVAHAHVLALDALDRGDPEVCGRTFFITDETPALNFLEFMEPIVEGAGLSLPPRSRRIPYPVMWIAALGAELFGAMAKPFGVPPPVLNRSSLRFVCKTHTFDGSLARRCLGYAPKYGYAESLERTIAFWRAHEDALRAAAT